MKVRLPLIFFSVLSVALLPAARRASTAPVPKECLLDSPFTKMKFVRIIPFKFTMGSPPMTLVDEKDEPQYEVDSLVPYCIGIFEVTVDEFHCFVQTTKFKTDAEINGSEFTWKSPGFPQTGRHPVTCISWNDARSFAKWLSSKDSREYRLPTETEWEFACRGGFKEYRHFGVGSGSKLSTTEANFNGKKDYFKDFNPNDDGILGDNLKHTTPVGNYKTNGYGLHDMNGNVSEWCSDTWNYEPQKQSPPPQDIKKLDRKVLKGGSWQSSVFLCRTSIRRAANSKDNDSSIGFRLVWSQKP